MRIVGRFRSLCILSMLAASTGLFAQAWPSKPVTLMVPFAPGGTTDIVARPFAQALSEEFGQSFVVENRAGAGGTLAAGVAARAAPDGYTLFVATVAHTMATSLYKQLPYDFEKDFVPITLLASVPNILVVNPSVPAKSVQELVAYAKANLEQSGGEPGRLTPDQFAVFIKSETAKWAKVVKESKATVD